MNYQEALLSVNKMKDRQGISVDSGIKKVVAALMMHGVKTANSCEGHMDYGFPYPWVDVDGTCEMIKLSDHVKEFYSWSRTIKIFPLQVIEMGYYKDNARLQSPNFNIKHCDILERNESLLSYLREEMDAFADYLISIKTEDDYL